MQATAKVRVVRYTLLIIFCLIGGLPVPVLGQICGDIDGSGGAGLGDLAALFAYLFQGGPPPANNRAANTDGIGAITNNDLVTLNEYIFNLGPLNCANTGPNPLFPLSSDTVEFRELIVPPGNSSWDVEVWIKSTGLYHGLSLPFVFDCPTSPLTIQNITFSVSGAAYQSGTGTGLIGMAIMGPGSYPPGEAQLATISFSINSSLSDQRINMDTSLSYAPSNTLVLSRVSGGVNGYRPIVVEILPEEPLFTEVETFPADVVSIVTADIDLDTYTDVIYSGDTEVGMFVSWGQDADPPIATGVKFADLTDAAVEVYHIDGDTLPDIVAVTTSTIYTLINNGDRTFTTYSTPNSSSAPRQPGQEIAAFGSAPQIALGFIDGDTYPDLVVTPDKWFAGDGIGQFSNNPAFGFSFVSVAMSDFDLDGYDDMVVVESDSAVIYTNSDVSPGVFTKSDALYLGLGSYDLSSITTNIDVNLDGLADVVAVIAENTGGVDESIVTVALGDGAGNLTLADALTIAGTAPQVSLSDVDRDFYQDVVVSNASDGNLEIYYNDGANQFGNVDVVDIALTDDLMFALASADLDRDGQPDFVSGSAAGENLVLALNNLPDEPVLDDELFVTGYDYINIQVTNPNGFVVSPNLQTVAGSNYYRLHVDGNGLLDDRAYDYNLQYGTYTIVATYRPGASGTEPMSVGIGIDGTQKRSIAENYTPPDDLRLKAVDALGSFIFQFEIEEVSSIFPRNGIPTANPQPTFDWSGLTQGDPSGDEYRFQLNRYHDFSDVAIYDAGGLLTPEFTPGNSLELDSVYYWRSLTSSDGGATYFDTSFVFAAYLVEGCCGIWTFGFTGNADCSDDGRRNLADITIMIDRVYVSKTPLCCEEEGNVDGDLEGRINLSDITRLIDHVYVSKDETAFCR